MHAEARPRHPALAALAAALGHEHVLTAPADLEFYSTDVYASGRCPLAVVRPGDTDQVRRIVEIAAEHGCAVVPRGGGASYTDGYLPTREQSLLVDTSRLDRIVKIDVRDMYVVVEAGVTWAKLDAALAPLGVRTPFYGPFSGLAATVGGSISQNTAAWGSGQYGVSADSVLGLELVTGDAQVLRTGTWGAAGGTPFFRHYGPDLTGLFTGDTGALGIKTRIALRLVRRPRALAALSFRFGDFDSMLKGMEAAAAEGLNNNNFALDPALQQGQIGKAGVGDAVQAALAVYRNSRNPLEGALRVARMALAGKRVLASDAYAVHYVVEGVDRAAARANAAALRDLLAVHGVETANTIPQIVAAMPFAPLHNALGPRGERWVPLHGLLPFSKVGEFHRDLRAYWDANAERMQRHKVVTASMFMTVATNAFLYEPVYYWQDVRNACLERLVPADYLKTLPVYPPNPEGRALVDELKRGVMDLFHRHGAAHLQIGKAYPYLRGREATATRLVQDIKQVVDPHGRMNPGALGL